MIEEKERLRKKLITERLAADKDEASLKSRVIIQKLIDGIDWTKVKKVHIYTALTPVNEIDTSSLQDYIASTWPHIRLSTSPARKDAPMPDEQFDLIIVPVLGFDKDNYRLGMGGGWYDRFLAKQTNAKTIGLAYRDAFLENMPHESHDIPLQSIITD